MCMYLLQPRTEPAAIMEGHLFSRPATSTLEALYEMYSSNTLTDVTLLSSNNEVIQAHSSILSAASPLIKTMLCNGTYKWERKLKFENVRYKVLKQYVDSLYVEYQHIGNEMIGELYHLATFLNDNFLTETLKRVTCVSECIEMNPINVVSFAKEHEVLSSSEMCSVVLDTSAVSDSKLDPLCITQLLPSIHFTDESNCPLNISDNTKNMDSNTNMSHHTQKIGLRMQSEFSSDTLDNECKANMDEDLTVKYDNSDEHTSKFETDNKSFWKCEKCKRVLCTHRQQKMTHDELDYATCREGIVTQEPTEKQELNFANLSPSQRVVAEKYRHILMLPFKLLVDPELRMKKILYPCPYCEYFLLGFSSLLQHLATHGEQLPMLNCCLCSKSFETKSKLRKHDMSVHQGQHRLGEKNGTRLCQVCGVKYCTDWALQRHIENHSNDLQEIKNLQETRYTYTRRYNSQTRCFVRNYTCTECGRNFKQQQGLEQHLSSAHGMKIKEQSDSESAETVPSYICFQCGSGFVRSSSLRAHRQSVHAVGVKFQCELCSKAYKAPNSLRAHIQQTHGQDTLPEGKVSEFQCSECGKFVPSERVYKAHMRYHRSEGKPLQCRMCDQRFKYHSGRLRHEKALHGKVTKR